MSWAKAKINIGSKKLNGMVSGERVVCPCPEDFEEVSEITVNGKKCNVASCQLDSRDGFLHLTVAMATTKKGKSDDKSVKGSDTN
jgi:hypothetical protein